VDESTVTQDLSIRACWMKRGQQKRLPAPPGANAFHHVIGALNWRSQQLAYTLVETKNSETFIEFLEHLLHVAYPQERVVLVMDNAPWHRSHAVQATLSLYESRVLVIWLPPYCPMLNPIERFWRHMKDTAYANTLYKSMNDLLDNVNEVLSAQNTINHPLRLNFVA